MAAYVADGLCSNGLELCLVVKNYAFSTPGHKREREREKERERERERER